MKRMTIDPDHPAGRPRQDRDLPRRGRRRRQHLLPDPGAARLRTLLRRPAGGGDAAADQPHLRRLPGGPPHGGGQGRRRGLSRRSAPARQAAPRTALQRLLRHRPYHPLLRPGRPGLHRRARMRRSPSATSSASSTRSGWRSAARSSRCASTGHNVIEMHRRPQGPSLHLRPRRLTKGITEEQRVEIERMGRWAVEFAQFSLGLFDQIVLGNNGLPRADPGRRLHPRDLLHGHGRRRTTRSTSTTARIRVVAPDGERIGKYAPGRVPRLDRRARRALDLPQVPLPQEGRLEGLRGRRGLGRLLATPLCRLNAADGMATPLAQAEYERFYATLAPAPRTAASGVHQRLAIHWARLIELLYAAERWVELATDPEITSPNVRTVPTETPTEGVGIVEAPRGTLTHHYWTDERGVVTKVNLIVGTTNNYAPISHVDQEGRPQPDPQWAPSTDGLAEPGRDGLPCLRSVLRLRHPLPARPDAARGRDPRRGRSRARCPPPVLLIADGRAHPGHRPGQPDPG